SYLETALIQSASKAPDQGMDMLRRAKEILQQLTTRYSGRTDYRQKLAEIINAQGLIQFGKLEYSDAQQSFHEVQNIATSLRETISGPTPVVILDLLAISYYNLAAIEKHYGHIEGALALFEQSLKYLSDLVDKHESVTGYQVLLGKNYVEVARLQHDVGQ